MGLLWEALPFDNVKNLLRWGTGSVGERVVVEGNPESEFLKLRVLTQWVLKSIQCGPRLKMDMYLYVGTHCK